MATTEEHLHADHVHSGACEPDAPRASGILPSWTPAVVVGLIGIAACVVLNVRDPNVSGSYGLCPSQALLGIDCPGCGLMRGTHALTEGDVLTALDHNLFIIPVLGAIVYAYLRWAGEQVGWSLPRVSPKPWMIWTIAGVALTFWVMRNVGGPFEYLAATAA